MQKIPAKWFIVIIGAAGLLGLTYTYIHYFESSLGIKNYSTIDQDTDKRESIKNIKILCWVLTSPKTYASKGVVVQSTWGKRCDTFLLMSSANDTNPKAIALNNTVEGYDFLWSKTREAFKYIWEHHRNDADWFLKADDNTFVIVENLRLMIHEDHHKTSDPIWLGSKLRYFEDGSNRTTGGYMSGGSGYVLSKEALRRFAEEALPKETNDDKCSHRDEGDEDVEIGKCLDSVGVEGVDTRDKMGRHRFLRFEPATHANMNDNDVHWNYTVDAMFYPQKKGAECCSNRAVSFHYVTASKMRDIYFLLYHVRPFGNQQD